MVGTTISHYKITEKLGEGGMGVVYKAEDTKLRRDVAIKLLAPHLVRDEEGRKRFEREAMAAAALDHPNVCTVYEIDEADKRNFIVMAFLEGRTLGKRIADGPLKLPEALSIAIQMAEGLEAAHEKGVVHRDIKPDNVMLMKGSRGLVKLMDFGLAQLAESSKLTREGTTLGTPIYMSPEQALGESTDRRSDVWALGVVLYEMVAGQPPFRGEVDQAVIYAIANEQHELLTALRTGVPKELERITDKCLAKDAEERYQHVTDLLVDLQACRRALEPGTPKPSTRATPVNRASLAAAGAAVVLAGLGLAWWLTRSSETAAVPQYKLTQITRDTGYAADPALSPNGQLLAYASDRQGDGNLDIWVQQLTGGGNPVRLTEHEADDYAPSFSPDGSRIVFSSNRDDSGIYVVPALGGSPTRIGRGGRGDGISTPRFSPDGKWVSYSRETRDRDYQFFSQIEIVPVSGGAPQVVEIDLPAAITPIWSPDGQHLLFVGSEETGGTGQQKDLDWWLVPAAGGEPVRLGARGLFERHGIAGARNIHPAAIERKFPAPRTWMADGNRVVFGGAIGGAAANLWQVRISPSDARLVGEPQRLTAGTGEEDPSASQDGRIAFVNPALDWDIWSLPLDTNRAEVQGEPERVVSGLSNELYPSISSDGQRLAYVSDRAGNLDIWLHDLETGEDTPITIGPESEDRGTISPNGSMISFVRREQGKNNLYVMNLVRRRTKLLVEGVGSMFDWMPGGKRILYYTPPPLRYKTVDAETGEQVDVDLTHPDYRPLKLRFSPDGEWLAFNLSVQPEWPLFISHIEQGQPTAHDEWIPITKDSVTSQPWWSPDGNTLYFLYTRDGFRCIYAQPLEPATKKPQGPLKSIRHFHGRVRTVPGRSFGYAMTSDRLYLPLSEPKANIWLAEPVAAQ
jgi:serine/threonine protein kinase